MKNLLLLVAALLSLFVSNAQITLNSGSYPASVTGTDSLKIATAASAFPSLTPMANGFWDMSIVTDTTPVYYAYRVPTATYQFADSNFYSFSNFSYQGNVQSSIDTGLLEYGINIQRAAYSLPTGGPTDSLLIPAQDTLYSSPRIRIAFPANYNSFWASSYHFNVHFMITVALATLSNAPGVISTYFTEKDSVTGWGKMRVKNLVGTASDWFDVLQVQTKIRRVDSFFINGEPASSPILSGLGLVQGQITTTYEHNYYRAEEVTPLANVRFSDSTYATPVRATTHTQRLVKVGVADVSSNSEVNIYPNPVCDGQAIISLPGLAGAWSYQLIDAGGRLVAEAALTISGNKAQLALPKSVTAGMYIVKLSNNGKQICVRSIDVVK